MLKRLLLIGFLWMCVADLVAQIHGVVIDAETGDPVPYLNVYYEGKGVGTTTNIDGEYSVKYYPGWTRLTFSMVGYDTQVVTVSAKTTVLKRNQV